MVLGVLAGYFGGLVDAVICRVIDVLLALPNFLVALVIVGFLGNGLNNLVIAIAVVWWAGYARLVRSAVLAKRECQYVEAAKGVGASRLRVMWRHVIPNIVAPLVVLTSLDMGAILLALAGLSFLGLGVVPPNPEWGVMLSEARPYLARSPNLMLYPGICIFLFVLGFNLVGDGLRDALDPRSIN